MVHRIGKKIPQVRAAFVAWSAEVAGDVTLAEDTSIWFGAALRADIAPAVETRSAAPGPLFVVAAAEPDGTLRLGDGRRVRLSGLQVRDAAGAVAYLRHRVVKKRVFLRDPRPLDGGLLEARVILKNRISVNVQLVRQGFAVATEKRNGGG